MAKQKTNIEPSAQGVGADTFQDKPSVESQETKTEPVIAPVEPANDPPVQSKDDTPKPKPTKAPANEKKQEKSVSAEPDSYILEILKSFSQYRALYIDRQGGVFTSNTPKNIRGAAVLYNNPYYNS